MVFRRKKSGESRVCALTRKAFEIPPEEAAVYNSFDLNLPVVHPLERLRRRLSFKNAGRFFWRKCDATGAKIYTVYSSNAPFPVFSIDSWKDDSWSAEDYSRKFLFDKPFFEQLYALWTKVPRPAWSYCETERVRAVHNVHDVKDSFLVFDAHHVERCYYSGDVWRSVDIVDCYRVFSCRHCYECVDCHDCSSLRWSEHCRSCSDSWFLSNCVGCKNCLFCADLENAEYCVFNEQLTAEDFERKVTELQLTTGEMFDSAKESYIRFLSDRPLLEKSTDKAVADRLYDCDRAQSSFDCKDSSDVFHCNDLSDAVNCIDGTGFGEALENAAQFVNVGANARNLVNCVDCYGEVADLLYCVGCERSSNLFACVGLKEKEFCILNHQFTESDYYKERDKIIAHLKKKQIWGVWLPAIFSGFAYNHSSANETMPLNEVQAQMLEYRWEEDRESVRPSQLLAGAEDSPEERFSEVPARLEDVDLESVAQKVYLCEMTGNPFQLTKEEIGLYKALGVAPPQRSFPQRQRERLRRLKIRH